MPLLTPQPNQSFWHVPPAGNSYHSAADRQLVPLTAADEAALIALGCVPVEPATDDEPLASVDVSEAPVRNHVILDYTER